MTAVMEVAKVDYPGVPLLILDDPGEDSSCGQSEEGGLNGSDSEPKDSGIDSSADVIDVPDMKTSEAILKMVEFYLSDENILKDPFLLKHVRRNKEGYVSVKLLASFRKVRSLCSSWQAVTCSLANSKVLELNSDGTKVRRLTPLPDHDETTSSRMIVAHGFETADKPSVDSISDLFSKCGDIALVRIIRPGGSTPTDIKRFLVKNPEIQSQVCALVEFEDHASTQRALDMSHSGFQVQPLVGKGASIENQENRESPKKKKKTKKRPSKTFDDGTNLLSDTQYQNRRGSSGSLSSQSSGYLSSSPMSSFFDQRFNRRHSFNPSTKYGDSFNSLDKRNHGSKERLSRVKRQEQEPHSQYPKFWRSQCREQEKMTMSDSNLSTRPSILSTSLSLPVKTLRMPKGPDGTAGFCPRSRPRLPSTAE